MNYRDLCVYCNRARATCFCKYTKPFATRTRFVILMHPREFKRQRTGTGRVTRVSLINSEILVGVDFTRHERLNQILADSQYFPVLLFPGKTALNISSADFDTHAFPRQPLVIILDATWPSARKMLNESTNLQLLPRISFDYGGESGFVIKRQPAAFALSTIEATYRVLDNLDRHGYEALEDRHHALIETLNSIVAFQLRCEEDPNLPSHRLNTKRRRALAIAPDALPVNRVEENSLIEPAR